MSGPQEAPRSAMADGGAAAAPLSSISGIVLLVGLLMALPLLLPLTLVLALLGAVPALLWWASSRSPQPCAGADNPTATIIMHKV
jgi:hypothetical protein